MAFKLDRREERPATIAEHRALRDEIARLKEQLSHGMPAIEELTKEREMYRMRWLGSMTTRDTQLIRDENERLKALLADAVPALERHWETVRGGPEKSARLSLLRKAREVASAHEQALGEKK